MSRKRSTRFDGCSALALLVALLPTGAHAQSTLALRFYGHGTGQIDRVEIPIDGPERPADVGSGDFTVEFWMKALDADNAAGACVAGNDGWINGNIVVDRDIYGPGDYGDFGIALFTDGLAFGVADGSGGIGLCGSTPVDDGAWHHVAATRSGEDIALWVDGVLDGSANGGPSGNISYRNGRSGEANDPFLVFGAEKHDAGPGYPSYSGLLDELRISTIVRYAAPFTPPATEFTTDADTVALYHFDEGSAGACTGTIVDDSGAAGGPSNGSCEFGGSAPAGPIYVTDTAPLGASLCGNGVTDPGESCDDGNVVDGDGCDADCTPTTDVLLSGRGLTVQDRAADPSGRKLVVSVRDAALGAPAPGSPFDPRMSGATLVLARGVDEVATLVLPASGWSGLGVPSGALGYRYADKTLALGPCKSGKWQGGRQLKLTCVGSGIPFTLDEPSQGQLGVTFVSTGSSARACMVFGGIISKDVSTASGGTGQFKAKLAPAPLSCPVP